MRWTLGLVDNLCAFTVGRFDDRLYAVAHDCFKARLRHMYVCGGLENAVNAKGQFVNNKKGR